MASGAAGIGGGLGGLPSFEGLGGSAVGRASSAQDSAHAAGSKAVGGFGDVLKAKLTELNDSQADAAQAVTDVATGRVDDIAQTMMRIEQASVSLQMATQLRNKAIEAYQEILRMQI